MLQRTAFQKLRAYADNKAYTPDQVRNADKEQVLSQLVLTDDEVKQYRYLFNSMKEILLKDALGRELQARLVLFLGRIQAVYPLATNLTSERAKEIATEIMPYLYGEI